MEPRDPVVRPEVPDPVLREEVRELDELAARKRRSSRWHALWAALGVSPAAAVPMMMGFEQIGFVAVVMLSVLVCGTELWRASRDRSEAEEAETRAAELRSGADGAG